MSTLDIIFLIVIGLFGLKVFANGFIKEIVSLAALVLGLVCAVLFFKPAAEFIKTRFSFDVYPEVVAFLGIFILVFLVAFIVEKVLHGALEAVNLEGMDRVLGLLLGLVEGVIAVCLVILALQTAAPYVKGFWDVNSLLSSSVIAGILAPLLDVRDYIKNV